jgi:hypothetical protein
MEVVRSSGTPVNLYQSTRRHIPGNNTLLASLVRIMKAIFIALFITMQNSTTARSDCKAKTRIGCHVRSGQETLVIHETACDLYKLSVLVAIMFPHPHSFYCFAKSLLNLICIRLLMLYPNLTYTTFRRYMSAILYADLFDLLARRIRESKCSTQQLNILYMHDVRNVFNNKGINIK